MCEEKKTNAEQPHQSQSGIQTRSNVGGSGSQNPTMSVISKSRYRYIWVRTG